MDLDTPTTYFFPLVLATDCFRYLHNLPVAPTVGQQVFNWKTSECSDPNLAEHSFVFTI